jgi:prevent-host-death family protein
VATWQLQEAKQRLSELIRAAEHEGAQVVTRRGREVAVVIDAETFHRLSWAPADFKDYLMHGPEFDELEIDRDDAAAPLVDLG